MISKKLKVFFCVAVLVIMAVGVGVYAAGVYGSQDDPLITKSYLDDVLTPELEAKFQSKLSDAVAGQAGTFEVLDMTGGQTLTGYAGCEIILRSGSATVLASGAGIVNTTAGISAGNASAVAANNLYMIADDGDGLKAGSGGAKVLVCGSYSIG